jgi:Phosphotransferase enzyme family
MTTLRIALVCPPVKATYRPVHGRLLGMAELAGPLAALARRVAGEIAEVTDCSWPREGSAVWRVSGPHGCWYVKRHSSALFHQREVTALRHWGQALGPGRAPALAAADSDLLAVVMSALPGQPVCDRGLGEDDEQEVHRQAGILLWRLHEAARPVASDAAIRRITTRVEGHLQRAEHLLTPAQSALTRRSAERLGPLAAVLPAVPIHGDAQPRNWLWDPAAHRLAMIDFERAEVAPPVRDLVRLVDGAWDGRPDLAQAFFAGYGRALSGIEEEVLTCFTVLDAVSGLGWGPANGDGEVIGRARKTFARLLP